MKKTKILLLLLTLVMLISAFPIAGTFGDEVTSIGESDNGMVLNKTAVDNGDGTYTISLEAFATGTSFISNVTENVPTDIVIVVDQSGSMKEFFETTPYSTTSSRYYTEYSANITNEDLFSEFFSIYTTEDLAYRDNMYYLSGSVYRQVKMTKTYETTYSSEGTVAIKNIKDGTQYYVMKDGQYYPVEITITSSGGYYYVTYKVEWDSFKATTTISNAYADLKTHFGCDNNDLYIVSGTRAKYTYTSTVNGVTTVLHTSYGVNTRYDGPTLYHCGTFSSTKTKLAALQEALKAFLNNVQKNSTDSNGEKVNNRVAIATFASGEMKAVYTNGKQFLNTGLYVGNTFHQYSKAIRDNDYKDNIADAFFDVSTIADYTQLTTTVNKLTSSGATATDVGLQVAEDIFENDPLKDSGEKRNKVVVVFTDGNPGNGYAKANGTFTYSEMVNANTTTANNAITIANELKSDYGATVYTIGVQAGADPTSPGSPETGGEATAEPPFANWFLHNVSSNNGEVPSSGSPGYYLSASNTAELTSIFEQIATQVQTGGTSITLKEETVIKDYVTKMFDLHGTTVTLETWHCTNVVNDSDGKTVYTWVKNDEETHSTHTNEDKEVDSGSYTWSEAGSGNELGASYTIDYDKKLVSITGFNYSDNWVGTVEDKTTGTTTYRGNKIVLTFTVHPEAGFLGGNDVFTNTPDSGIYKNEDEDEPVDEFPVPDVDVTVPDVGVTEMPDITAAAHDIDVYLFESVTLADIKKHTTVTVGGAELDLTKPDDNYGLADWQTEYVNISVVYKDASGKTFTSYDNLTADTTYTVVATVTPKKEGTATGKTGSDTGSIWVYKPVLTYKDNVAYYGGPAVSTDWETDYLVSTAWKHGNTTARTDIMEQAPTLNKTYTWDSIGKITDGIIKTKQDIPVDVSVKIGNSDVSQYVTFAHKDCSTDEDIGSAEFVVHVNTCSLTISKTGAKNGEPCVFTVLKDGEYYTQVTLNGQTGTTVSKTLYELPVGTYSIAEDEEWSWRYEATYSGNGVTLSASNPSATISCTNTETNSSWLNYFSEIIENIFGISKNAD